MGIQFAVVNLARLLVELEEPGFFSREDKREEIRVTCVEAVNEIANEEMPRLARLLIGFPLGETIEERHCPFCGKWIGDPTAKRNQ